MADEKITTLIVDGKPAKDAYDQLAAAAENAGDKLDKTDAVVSKTETTIKRLASSTREYNAAARMVADSNQNLVKFQQAYQAALRDTVNSEQTRANILRVSAARTIGVTMDEKQALDLLRGKHADVTTVVRQFINTNGQAVAGLNNSAKASRASAYQYQNLAYQLNDVVSGLAMGQRPMQVLAQQGGQIFQIFSQMNSPIRAIGGLLMTTTGIFTMAGAAIAGAAYAGISYGNSIKALDLEIRNSNGLVGLSTSQLAEQAKQIAETGKVSEREARQSQDAFVTAGTVGGENYRRLLSIMGDVARAMNTDVKTASEEVAKAMGDPAKAAIDLNNKYFRLTAEQQRHIAELQRAGDIEKAQAELIDAMSDKIGEADTKTGLWTRTLNGLSNAWRSLGRSINGVVSSDIAASTIADKLAAVNAQLEAARTSPTPGVKNDAALIGYLQAERDRLQALLDKENAAAAKRGETAPGERARTAGYAIADKAIPETKKGLEEQAATLLKARDAAKEGTEAYRRLSEAYEAVSNAAATWIPEGEREVMLAEARAKASTMTAAEGQKYLSEKTAEINMLGRVISASERERIAKASSLEANTAYAKAMREQGKALSIGQIETQARLAETAVDKERQALAQRRALGEISAVEELTQAIAIDDKKRAVEEGAAAKKLALLRRTTGTERTEIEAAERALTEVRAKNAAERQKQLDAEVAARRNQVRQIAELNAQAAATSATAGVDSRAENLRFGKAMGTITGVSDIADQERAIAAERYQIERNLLEKKLALADQEPAQRKQILDQITALEERHKLNSVRLAHEETQSRLAEIRTWTEPVKSAMNGMVQGIFQGTQTARQVIANFGQSVVASYANTAAQAVAKWIESHIILAAWNRLTAQQDVATTVAAETAKTSATAMGTAARNAIGQTEHDSLLSRIVAMVAGWLGFETAKTAETVVGAGARKTAEVAAATASVIAAKAEAVGTIPPYTGIAAIGAASAMAPIPIIGPALAAGAFKAMLALGASAMAISSAKGGEESVPFDGALYRLHAKETVLPSTISVPLNNALKSGVFRNGIPNMKMASIAAARMPIFGLPGFIARGPHFASSSTTTNTSNRGGDVHVHNAWNVSAIDARGVKELLTEQGPHIARVIAGQVRSGNRDARFVAGRKS